MPEDIAVILSKSGVDPCTHDRDIDPTKNADRRMAFQLFIVDI